MGVAIKPLTGHQIAIAVADLASLRITVFADWPYLYDGDLAYEEDYLREFAEAQDAVLVLARDGERAVGAATASPMMARSRSSAPPSRNAGSTVPVCSTSERACSLPAIAAKASATPFSTIARRRRGHAVRRQPASLRYPP
jgi:hypothetical protein